MHCNTYCNATPHLSTQAQDLQLTALKRLPVATHTAACPALYAATQRNAMQHALHRNASHCNTYCNTHCNITPHLSAQEQDLHLATYRNPPFVLCCSSSSPTCVLQCDAACCSVSTLCLVLLVVITYVCVAVWLQCGCSVL